MSDHPIYSPRKLIEVALPLEAINVASAREKGIRPGHPSAMHQWWARRPLAAARAVIFAQLVNDPGYQQGGGFKYGKNKKDAAIERKRLFKIIEDLVLWENTTNEVVLERARAEIRRSWREVCDLNKDHPQAAELFNPEKLPALHDPFAGGGAIPLEAQRLGLEAYASDLNPVAVLINKAMIEIPPKFAGRPPVHPDDSIDFHKREGNPGDGHLLKREWKGAQGLVEDVRYYGQWMCNEAERRIGNLYPKFEITTELSAKRPDLEKYIGRKLTVIAWIWARTIKSPNPAFSDVDVPLASTFILSTKAGKEAYIEPVIEGRAYHFKVLVGNPEDMEATKNGTKLARGANFKCVMSGTPISGDYIKAEGKSGRMGARMLAIVAVGDRERVYLSPTDASESLSRSVKPTWQPDVVISGSTQYLGVKPYGMNHFSQLFTSRQLVALTTLSDLVAETRERVRRDALAAGMPDGDTLVAGGHGASGYADALGTYLAFGVSKTTNRANTLATWMIHEQCPGHLFRRQAIPMTWDFCESNSVSGPSGSFLSLVNDTATALEFSSISGAKGFGFQADAAHQTTSIGKVISTDPPYYDNVPYADLSDFFYVWLRRSLKLIHPDIFATISVPKSEELVAFAYRHKDKSGAESFFLGGMTHAMHRLFEQAHPAFPVTIYYAFKQSETSTTEVTTNTGWDTFLAAVIEAGFAICGTWPMRTERPNRSRNQESNALASSIILVCRKRPADAPTISRREFIRELNGVLPEALDEMTKGAGDERSPVAPVDLSQAIIGPGMAVFSKYAAVLEADGSPMSVRTALQLINRFLAEDDFDADTQFCLHWFEQHGWTESVFGEADVLARSKSTSVDAMKEAGVLQSGSGKVRLLKWAEYPTDWDPRTDKRTPVWEALHQLIRALKSSAGEGGAGVLLAALGGKAEAVRQLAYRLYTLCERLGQAEDARAYNELITSWTGIESVASRNATPAIKQGELFDN